MQRLRLVHSLLPRCTRSLNTTSLCCASTSLNKDELVALYDKAMTRAQQWPLQHSVHRRDVFANTELDLSEIHAYGFDYDYTMAIYTVQLNELIYNLALDRLITEFNFPPDIKDVPYDPKFAIRGLHFDVRNGLLLKLDQYLYVAQGTVFRGKRQLTDEQVLSIYPRHYVPQNIVELRDTGKVGVFKKIMKKIKELTPPRPNIYKKVQPIFRHLPDLFSLPEIGLISTVIDCFDRKGIEFDPVALMDDVGTACNEVHASGQMYRHVISDMDKYVHKNVGLHDVLQRLKDAGKTLFLITNSPYSFLNPGMTYMLGDQWREMFHSIIVQARKPEFFKQSQRPFRLYDDNTSKVLYHPVKRLEPGKIYVGGNIKDFSRMADLDTKEVLYFGDHIGADLTDVMLNIGWHTACVVPELAAEIAVQNSPPFRSILCRMMAITQLLQQYQDDARVHGLHQQWVEERNKLTYSAKAMLNPQFGSMFRTQTAATYFSRRLTRLADIYTSRLPNLLKYSLDHTFYPRRQPLAHELDSPIPLEELEAP